MPSEAFGGFGPSELRGLKAFLGASGYFGGFGGSGGSGAFKLTGSLGRCQSQDPGLVAFLFFWASRGSVSHDGGLCSPVFLVEVIGQGGLKAPPSGLLLGVFGCSGSLNPH